MRWPSMLLVVSLGMPAFAAPATPETTTQAFYSWVLAHPRVSLPSSQERRELSKLLSPSLLALLESTSKAEEQCIAVTPQGNKPLIFEGSLFVGNYEGAAEVAYGPAHSEGRDAVVDVDLMDIDPRWPKGHKYRSSAWRDRLKLRREGKRWAVNDIVFPDGSLVAELKKYVEVESRHCGGE